MTKKVSIRTFGCQMNQADTEIISSLLTAEGYCLVAEENDADLVMLNTCAVRENAVEKIMHHLDSLKGLRRRRRGLVVGVIGCVPQYYREEMFQKSGVIDFIAGPDSYRKLPELIHNAFQGIRGAELFLTQSETYGDIKPLRSGSISAFIPVMRGCNNMCAFCVVPFTRGRERSRSLQSVLDEVRRLAGEGYRELTLLGQNVNSYRDDEAGADFALLLDEVSKAAGEMRVRFTTSHPKDISEDLVNVVAERENVCNAIHLPVQSGSSRMLEVMHRGHTRREYLDKIAMIRSAVPGVALSTDLIAGFCGETEEDHLQTLRLMEEVRFDYAYMFYYSVRPGTYAARHLTDDVALEVKKRRLQEIIDLQGGISGEIFRKDVGSVQEVLAESESRRSSDKLMGRSDTNRVVVFDRQHYQPGELVRVVIESSTQATLIGRCQDPGEG